MWEQLKEWALSLLGKAEPVREFEDYDKWKRIIEERQEHTRKAEEIVGKDPLMQIDYIIKNGLDEFNKVYYKQDDESPAEQKMEIEEKHEHTFDKSTIKVYVGGKEFFYKDGLFYINESGEMVYLHVVKNSNLLPEPAPPQRKPMITVTNSVITMEARGGRGNAKLLSWNSNTSLTIHSNAGHGIIRQRITNVQK